MSDNTFHIIEHIAATSAKTGKEAIIAENAHDETFKKALVYALSPYMTFGIGKLAPLKLDKDGTESFTEGGDTWRILDLLANRTLSGNAARSAVDAERARLSPESRALFERIVLQDLRAGFSSSTVNKAIPGLVPTFDCMLAHPFNKYAEKVEYPIYVEPKLDGVRVLAFVDTKKGTVSFFSRTGKEFTAFEHLKKPVLDMVSGAVEFSAIATAPTGSDVDTFKQYFTDTDAEGRFVLDGEVVSGKFNKTVSEVRKKEVQATDAQFFVFDVLPGWIFGSEEKGGQGLPYETRVGVLKRLVNTFGASPVYRVASVLAHSEEEVYAFNDKVQARGLEGTIAKNPKALYHRRRNQGWLKIKAEETEDLPVVGYYLGEEGKQFENTLGGLLVDRKGVIVRVGGGYSVLRDGKSRDEFLEAINEDLAILRSHGVFYGPPTEIQPDGKPGIKISPLPGVSMNVFGRLIEVEYHEVTPDGSLRHPRYVRFRDDKPLKEAA